MNQSQPTSPLETSSLPTESVGCGTAGAAGLMLAGAEAQRPKLDPASALGSHLDCPPQLSLLTSILSAIADPLYLKNQQGQWCFVNEAYCQLVGFTEAALLGQSEAAVFRAHEAAPFLQADQQVLATGKTCEQETLLTDASGCQRVLLSKTSLARDGAGEPILVTTLRDITEQQRAEAQLQRQVDHRTQELQRLLEFEATLKRITDRVRDSLDQKQIMLTAVKELTEALGVKGSNTALYDLEQGTSKIYYEYNRSLPSYQGRVAQMEAFPEVYNQLLEGQYFQFCSKEPNPVRGHVTMLACPILDDRGVLGDLWLIKDKDSGFNDPEIRLVQQVANQCAIAIRQARLYQAAQTQVEELERLNRLKDDFLSTVSHELRTPVTSMRVALQLLGVTLNQEFDLNSALQKPKAEQPRLARYYTILQEECEREISLINDLLDLQRLDVGSHPLCPEAVDLSQWLPDLVNGFGERAKSRQQQLTLVLPEELPPLTTDLASLERILAELLNNACKYTPPEEQICLEVRSLAGGGQVSFRLTNTGIEIPPAEISRIFDKFYRVPSADPWKQGGTGLGLALVQKLVMYLGGEITVDSHDQKTAFTVKLPTRLRSSLGQSPSRQPT
jgi:PAS domain S-box-containing protein